jgi:Zn-dependent protease
VAVGERTKRRQRPAGVGAVRLARIAGIDIVVAPSWFLSVVLIVALATPVVLQLIPRITSLGAAVVSVALAVLLALSVLAHELGHCLVARVFGIGVREVRLYLVGGVSELERSPASATEEALIAGAGPAVSALLAVGCWLLMGVTEVRTIGWLILIELAVANAIVAVFNILPALPLDGGRVTRALIWKVSRRRRAGTIVGVAGGFLVAAALIVWAGLFLRSGTRPGLLQAAIVLVMAAFVAAGAWAERPSTAARGWPSGMPLSAVARRVVPMAVTEPLAAALALPADIVVVVTASDGRAVGVVDRSRVAAPAVPGPDTASWAAVTPLEPGMIVSPREDPRDVIERVAEMQLPFIALLGEDGTVRGVVTRADIDRASAGPHRRRPD